MAIVNGVSFRRRDTSGRTSWILAAAARTLSIPLQRWDNLLMKYPVALTRSEEGYSVSCPGLPGCWSQGRTEEEALSNIRDAISEYLAVARQLAGERELREVEVPA